MAAGSTVKSVFDLVTRSQGNEYAKDFSPLFQPARVFVRFDDIARIVEKPNHGVM